MIHALLAPGCRRLPSGGRLAYDFQRPGVEHAFVGPRTVGDLEGPLATGVAAVEIVYSEGLLDVVGIITG